MKTFKKPEENKGIAIALGYFDAIHIAHKQILQKLVSYAHDNNLKSAVITFQKNPANYFSNIYTPDIETKTDKRKLMRDLGIDFLYELDFRKYKDLEKEEYLENILIKNFEPKLIIAGYNHTFGKGAQGNPLFLLKNALKYKYNCIVLPEVKSQNKKVSSSEIRRNISLGYIEEANELLGRNFSFSGKVIEGDKLASSLGYPTANLLWDKDIIKPPYGVYFGLCTINQKPMPALISWGTKPTLKNTTQEVLEVHIDNFSKNIYNKNIKVEFLKKHRNQKKFPNINELQKQIQEDYEEFKKFIYIS